MSVVSVGKSPGSLSGFLNTKTATEQRNLSSAQSTGSSEEADYSALIKRSLLGKRLDASRVLSAAAIATEAISQVMTIREKQLELASRAKNVTDNETLESLDAEYQSLQSEIERISDSAVVGSVAVIKEGGTFSVSQPEADYTATIGLPNYSTLTQDYGLSISSRSGAANAETTLAQVISFTGNSLSGASSAQQIAGSIAQQLNEERIEAAKEDSSIVTEPQEAEKVANKISEVVSKELEAPEQIDLAVLESIERDPHDLDPQTVVNLVT